MAVRYSSVFIVNLTKTHSLRSSVLLSISNRTKFYMKMDSRRMTSKYVITPNLKLNSMFPVSLDTKSDSFPILKTKEPKPLVLLLEYMNAKERHIENFVHLYMNYGFDVLQVHLKPWQLLWPTKGSQKVAKDLAQFLALNKTFSPMIVHGFSVGGYLWGEVVTQFSQNFALYQQVVDRIKCKIFDSAVDVNDIPIGFPKAVFPNNSVLRSAFEKYLRYHLKTFYEESTKHYYNSRKEFSSAIVKCPTLMITSKADPLSSVAVNEKVRQELADANLECHIKVFENSIHCSHFKKYRDEYINEIETLLAKVNVIQPQKIKAKL